MAYESKYSKEEEKELAKKKVEKALARIKHDVASVFNNNVIADFLKFAANFHYFDINNTLLIYKQRPTATFVASFKTWQKFSFDNWGDMNRPVFTTSQKGNGIGILVPYILRKKNTLPDAPKSKAISYLDYHVVFVFDKEQTNNIPSPVFSWSLENSQSDCEAAFNAFKSKAPFDIVFSENNISENYVFETNGANGKGVLILNSKYRRDFFRLCNYVIRTFVSHKLKNSDYDYNPNDTEKLVECVSYMVSCYFGLSVNDYIFFFVDFWCNHNTSMMLDTLDTIQRAAHNIIEEIEEEISFFRDLYGSDNDFDSDDIFEFSEAFNF